MSEVKPLKRATIVATCIGSGWFVAGCTDNNFVVRNDATCAVSMTAVMPSIPQYPISSPSNTLIEFSVDRGTTWRMTRDTPVIRRQTSATNFAHIYVRGEQSQEAGWLIYLHRPLYLEIRGDRDDLRFFATDSIGRVLPDGELRSERVEVVRLPE